MQAWYNKNVLVPSIKNSAFPTISADIKNKWQVSAGRLAEALTNKFKSSDLYSHITGEKDYQRYLESLDKQMQFNSAEAEKNRQFQEYMSNTSYQRQMEDLRKAGINPMLVLNNGGATSPSGSSASVSGSYTGNSGATVMSALGLGANFTSSIVNQSMRSITQLLSSAMSLFGSFGSSAMGLYGSLWRTQFNYDKLYGIARF